MLLNTKPRLSIWYSNVKPRFKHAIEVKFFIQKVSSVATLLNTKPRLSIWYSNSKPLFKHAIQV